MTNGLTQEAAHTVAGNLGLMAASEDMVAGQVRNHFLRFDSDNYNHHEALIGGLTPIKMFFAVYGHAPDKNDHGHGLALDMLMESFARAYMLTVAAYVSQSTTTEFRDELGFGLDTGTTN